MATGKRLMKELQDLMRAPPEGIQLVEANDMTRWILKVIGAPGTIYQGEQFLLQFTFDARYPFSAPEVIFVPPYVPMHPHIYTNGHICLNILYDDWTPGQTVAGVCLALLSMLSSNVIKAIPEGNDDYVRRHHGISPKNVKWAFHDDTV